MPIDPDVAIGAEVDTQEFSWTSSDVLLYHLAVGAGSHPGDNMSAAALRWTLDGPSLQVLPSFAVVAPTFHASEPPSLDLPGCDINLAQVVHGAQEVHVNAAVPTSGSASLTTRIVDIWDKGKAAVIWQEGVATDPDGTELWRVRSSIFVKGEGGWGGNRGESSSLGVPDRAPDASSTYAVTPQQALLYRLCGDRNPCTPIRRSRRQPASRRRSCTDSPRTASSCARSPSCCWPVMPPPSVASGPGSPASCSRGDVVGQRVGRARGNRGHRDRRRGRPPGPRRLLRDAR